MKLIKGRKDSLNDIFEKVELGSEGFIKSVRIKGFMRICFRSQEGSV